MTTSDAKPIRVLVIDDSAYNRQTITAMLEGAPGIQVVGRAGDGEEGLKLAFQLQPDVITLDLEMPKMDGFTFLRILMARQPTPVIVISGYATQRERLQGARARRARLRRQAVAHDHARAAQHPAKSCSPRCALVTQLRMVNLADRAARTRTVGTMSGDVRAAADAGGAAGLAQRGAGAAAARRHRRVDGRAAGDPSHPRQARADAAGRHRHHAAHAGQVHQGVRRAARSHDAVARRRGGAGRCAQRRLRAGGAGLGLAGGRARGHRAQGRHRAAAAPPNEDRYVPSVDRMFQSCATAMGGDVCAIVLTGMGGDGGRGRQAVKAAGGRTVAEAPETAVIFGMPQEAIATGAVDDVVPLPNIPELIARFAQKK